MSIQVERHEGNIERLIIIGMITDKYVLSQITAQWKEQGLFSNRWAYTIARWCVDYFLKHKEPPGQNIKSIFAAWSDERNGEDKTTVKMIDTLLSSLSEEYEIQEQGMNSSHIIDLAGKHFRKTGFQWLTEQLNGHIERNDLDAADEAYRNFRKTELGTSACLSLLDANEKWDEAFAEIPESLIKYPGDAGTFFKDALGVDCFVAFLAPEKRGKTGVMLDLAWRALEQRKRTLFINAGDLSQRQIMKRFGARACGRPVTAQELVVPEEVRSDGDGGYLLKTRKRIFQKMLTAEFVKKKMEEIKVNRVHSPKSYLELYCAPANTLSVAGVKSIIDGLIYNKDWYPEVVVIDYADILMPAKGSHIADFREKTNGIWTDLRSLSLQYHCLVVTATQANKDSYKADTMGMWNISEDKRKLAHCTGMIGINCSQEEKRDGILRFNWVVLREGEFDFQKCLFVAGSNAIWNPVICSCFAEASKPVSDED